MLVDLGERKVALEWHVAALDDARLESRRGVNGERRKRDLIGGRSGFGDFGRVGAGRRCRVVSRGWVGRVALDVRIGVVCRGLRLWVVDVAVLGLVGQGAGLVAELGWQGVGLELGEVVDRFLERPQPLEEVSRFGPGFGVDLAHVAD